MFMLRRTNSAPTVALPLDPIDVHHAAMAAGLTIPEACLPGVLANLALLDRHRAVLQGEREAT